MTNELLARLAVKARLDAKAFRENTVYDSEGNAIRFGANADRLDRYADALESAAAMREALELAANRLQRCVVDYIAGGATEAITSSRWVKEARQALATMETDDDQHRNR